MHSLNPVATGTAVLAVLVAGGVACATRYAAAASGPVAALTAPRALRAAPAAHVQVLGVQQYLLSVANLGRSVAFYRDVIGLPLSTATGPASIDKLDQSLTDTPGARFRRAVFRNPADGPTLVLSEYSGIVRRALRPRGVDPGAATVQVAVRDLGVVLVAAARAGTPIVTRGGQPLRTGHGAARDIVLRDPDGFYVRLSESPHLQTQAQASTVGPVGNVLGVAVQYTIAAPAAIVRFYHGVLGLRVQAEGFTADTLLDELFDVRGAQCSRIQAQAISGHPPDAEPTGGGLQFIAFRATPRHTYEGRPQDAGTPALALRVTNLTDALRAIRASGTIIVSAGGQPVLIGHGGAMVLIRDPAGVLVQLIQDPAGSRP
jgi:catechol 2,3-dioxygenase-like lactoylglutathione lyase family enzyme